MSTEDTGASILTEGAEPAPEAPQAEVSGAQQAVIDAETNLPPPEYIPEKFWDPKQGQPKVEDLGRSYMNLEKLLGREKVPVPTSDEDEEGWDRWYAATGRPDEPDGYEFKRPELPQDLPYDEEMEGAFRTFAHVNGLNKRQANNLYDGYVKTQLDRHAAYHEGQKQAKSKVESDLRREHGQQYDGKIAKAKTAIREFADPDYLAWLDETGMGNDPRMIRAWIRVGEKMTGETKLQGRPAPAANHGDLDRAIADFRSKHNDALYKRDHPDHNLRVQEYNKLFQARFGE